MGGILSSMYGWRPPRRLRQHDKGALRGRFSFELRDAAGKLLRSESFSNLIVNAGKAEAAALLGGLTADPFTYIALGEGTTGADVADTALEAEITTGGGERASATVSRVTTDVTNDTLRLVNTFTFTDAFDLTEVGIFNDATVGDMLCRQTYSVIAVVSTNTLLVTYDIDVD